MKLNMHTGLYSQDDASYNRVESQQRKLLVYRFERTIERYA